MSVIGFLQRLVSPKERLKHVLGAVGLPSFPAATTAVLKGLRDPAADAARLAGLVEIDPGLTVQVLRLVNSPAFGLRRRVDSVPHAVALAGRGALEGLVLAVAVKRTLPRAPAVGFDPGRFWRAAARRGATARAFADVLDPRAAAVSFTAGLLQDLAVPLLAHHHADRRYGEVLKEWHAAGGSLGHLERRTFGWAHSDVGGWLCEDWAFPKPLSEAIEGHHDAKRAPAPVLLVSAMNETAPERSLDAIVAVARDRFGACPDRIAAAFQVGADQGDALGRTLAA